MTASGEERGGAGAGLPRLPAAFLLAASALLGGCASDSGSDRVQEVDLYDLMARKPDAEPPDGPRPGGPLKGRPLERAVARTVERHRPAFQACIERASKETGGAHVRATLLLTVRADGVVSDARVAERKIRERTLGRCLLDASRRMSFPAFEGAPLQVKIPLELAAR